MGIGAHSFHHAVRSPPRPPFSPDLYECAFQQTLDTWSNITQRTDSNSILTMSQAHAGGLFLSFTDKYNPSPFSARTTSVDCETTTGLVHHISGVLLDGCALKEVLRILYDATNDQQWLHFDTQHLVGGGRVVVGGRPTREGRGVASAHRPSPCLPSLPLQVQCQCDGGNPFTTLCPDADHGEWRRGGGCRGHLATTALSTSSSLTTRTHPPSPQPPSPRNSTCRRTWTAASGPPSQRCASSRPACCARLTRRASRGGRAPPPLTR